jgi:two-component system, NtrC family, C4-dicarboxylate transport response regulator DctD
MKTATILLLLDEPQDLQIYGTTLRSLGYKVVLCGSPQEATDWIETESVDYVIISQDTPAFENRGILERIHGFHPGLPVLVVARSLDVHCYLEAMELGAVDYLERPEPRDLLWTVESQIPKMAAHVTAT